MLCISESQPALDESNLIGVGQANLVKPENVGSGRYQVHRYARFLPSLQPVTHLAPVRRITKNCVPMPGAEQPREPVLRAADGARVKRKLELLVQPVINSRWRGPLGMCGA